MQEPMPRVTLESKIGEFLRGQGAVDFKTIEAFADAFREAVGLHVAPFDPRAYLPLLGIALEPKADHPETPASWSCINRQYTIRYARLHPEPELPIWHEVFEILSAHQAFPTRLPPHLEEKLADRFAHYLMLPADHVRQQCAELGHPETNKSFTLAARFRVPKDAMLYRLYQLDLQHRYRRR